MAGADSKTQVQGPLDALGHDAVALLKDSYKVHDGKEHLDLASAGLNGYGDFVVIGGAGQVVRIPDHHRMRLAAHLLAPFLATEYTEKDPQFKKAMEQIRQDRQARAEPVAETVLKKPGTSKLIARVK